MKNLLIIFLYFFSFNAFALSFQLGTGSLTPHFVTNKKSYCNQWNNTGIIVNKTYYLRAMHEGFGVTYMQGEDSICSPIEGLFFHYTLERTDWIETGIMAGGYAFNQKNWEAHEAATPEALDAPEPVRTKYFGRDVVPVLALDVGIHLIRKDNWSLKLNNFFTPVIFNHSIAWEYRF